MGMGRSPLPGRRGQALLDAVLVLWAALWITVGFVVADQVRGLAELSDTVGRVGRATVTVGETIKGLPLIGDRLRGAGDDIATSGRQAVDSARTARESARSVATLLGLSIALIPSLPVLVLYVPGRVAGARERRALSRAVAAGREPWLDEILARRALVHLPYSRLRRISRDPLDDFREGRHAALADAELEWFGVLTPPPVSR
jgi:hypothetical protein